MIDIKFLRKRDVAGLEFMDFQYSSFFEELSQSFQTKIDDEYRLVAEPDTLMGVIARFTGIKNLELHLEDNGNLAVDSGFINPKNVFDIENIEKWLSRSESTLGKWFKNNNEQFLKGTIDYQTGQLGGVYSELPFSLLINKNLKEFLDIDYLSRKGITPAQALAAGVIHELGHIFGGIMMIHQEVKDNIIIRSALHFLTKSETTNDKVTVLKEANTLLEIDGERKTMEELAELDGSDEYFVYFKKATNHRNTSRALSLGVPTMNSEVIADAYSVRMGCGKSLIIGMSSIYRKFEVDKMRFHKWFSILLGVFFGMYVGAGLSFMIVFAAITFVLLRTANYLDKLTTTIYNSEYRRLLNIQQEMISKIKSDKTLDSNARRVLVNDIMSSMKVVNENKAFFEDTAFQRFALWLTHGGDGKFINIEHYTQSIVNHDITITSELIASLK